MNSKNSKKMLKESETVEGKTNEQEHQIEPEEFLEEIPEEERGKVAAIIKQIMFSGTLHKANPIAQKITSEHITQLIVNSNEQDKRDRKERKEERYYNLLLIVLTLLFVGFLIVFLQTNEELLIKIIIAIISFIGGFGFGKSKKNKTE